MGDAKNAFEALQRSGSKANNPSKSSGLATGRKNVIGLEEKGCRFLTIGGGGAFITDSTL